MNNNESRNFKITVLCFALFLIGVFCLLFFKPSKTRNFKVNTKYAERPKAEGSLKDINISPKTPIFRIGEKFSFKITKEIIFTGDMSNVELTFEIPNDISDRQRIWNLTINPKPKKIIKKLMALLQQFF